MNFELADKLTELLEVKKLDEAIELAENELRQIPETDFHKIIGKDLKHLTNDLKVFIETYGLNKQAPNLQTHKKMVKQAVKIYNNERVHWSLGLRTPEEVHRSYNSLKYKSYSKKAA